MSEREQFITALQDSLPEAAQPTPAQAEALFAHYQLLVRWNRSMNLTTVVKLPEAAVRHYGEALFLHAHLPAVASVADVGSGAGFPGIPVAICRPECAVYLIESHQRKAVFLREATRSLAHVKVLAQRLDDVQQPVELLVARAVNWDEVVTATPRLSRRVAFLIGEDDLRAARQHPTLQWAEPIPLPHGDRRFVLAGYLPE